MHPSPHDPALTQRLRRTAVTCIGIVACMVGLAYAAVPLYDLFCRVTGFDGTPVVDAADTLRLDQRKVGRRIERMLGRLRAGSPATA